MKKTSAEQNIKLFPQQWAEVHPNKLRDSSDLYYTGITNKVCDILHKSALSRNVDNQEVLSVIALSLTRMFEDVVSGIGLWHTFTTNCKARYGTHLPFYNLDHYFEDEINQQDIAFLLWHHLQQYFIEDIVLFPCSKYISNAASEIYELFDSEFDTAPENTTYKKYVDNIRFDEKNFYQYRELLEWFHYNNFFSLFATVNYENEAEELLEEFKSKDKDFVEQNGDVFSYSVYVEHMLKHKNPLLGLTSPEWLALWLKDHKQHALIESVKMIKLDYYVYLKEDERYVYFQCLYEDEVYNVEKASLSISSNGMVPQQSALYTSLVKYGNNWWQSGYVMDGLLKSELVQKVGNSKTIRQHIEQLYNTLIETFGGKQFIVFQTEEQAIKVFKKKIPTDVLNIENLFEEFKPNGPFIIFFTKDNVLELIHNVEGYKHPDIQTLLIDDDSAIDILLDIGVASYQAACTFIDNGLLVNLSFGDDNGHEVLQDNIQFYLDYNFKQNRDSL